MPTGGAREARARALALAAARAAAAPPPPRGSPKQLSPCHPSRKRSCRTYLGINKEMSNWSYDRLSEGSLNHE